ncbi:MAG: hypothetical protein KF729_30045 [Sandaracinaceae bacterium]|nr:hypothetical protein [Sandaracinaceae bacterium]
MIMRTCLCVLAALCLAACGGGDDASSSEPTGERGGGGETLASGGDAREPDHDAPGDGAEDEPDDGMQCLPVSRCHSFANQDCTLVDASRQIQDERFSSGSIERACPGQRGVAASVRECFDFVELADGCRRRPELRHPEWPCGRTDAARCGIVM